MKKLSNFLQGFYVCHPVLLSSTTFLLCSWGSPSGRVDRYLEKPRSFTTLDCFPTDHDKWLFPDPLCFMPCSSFLSFFFFFFFTFHREPDPQDDRFRIKDSLRWLCWKVEALNPIARVHVWLPWLHVWPWARCLTSLGLLPMAWT